MLEQKIEALTVAVEALTAILTSQGGAAAAPAAAAPAAAAPAAAAKTEEKAPAADKPKRTTKAPAADKPKYTKAEVQAAVNEVKENFDVATAKALIKEAGFDKLGDVTEDKFDELYEAAKAKMAELEGDGDEGGDDGL